MNFQNLEYFVAVVKADNITHAADAMHISQQALSGSISRLEKELGCTLFERHPQFCLTYSGKCFYKMALDMLDLKSQSETILADINGSERTELKVGISITRGQTLLPHVLPEFYSLHPHSEVTVMSGATNEIEEALKSGDVDAAIGFMPMMVENAEVTPLIRERLFLILPKSLLRDRLGEKAESILKKYEKERDISLFSDFPFILLKEDERIRASVDHAFASKNLRANVRLETDSIQTSFSLSAEGLGLAVCPDTYLKSEYTIPGLAMASGREDIYVLPFFRDDIFDTIGIGYNRDRYLSNTARDFIDICIRRAGELA